MTASVVYLSAIPAEAQRRHPELMHETFAVVQEFPGQPGVKILATDEDVPAGRHPEQFAADVAIVAGAQYVGLGRGLQITRERGRWVGVDTLACGRHGERDCESCTEGHTDPLNDAGAAPWLGDITAAMRFATRRAAA